MLAVGALGGIGRLGLVAAAVRQLFDPRLEFFSNGEQGVWYDPSDLSTLFQDSAGTTPVTAVEQPVGLMLDKRLGLEPGPDVKNTGVTGLVGSATAATYNTINGAGTGLRVDVSNQSFVSFSGLSAGVSYRLDISNTGSNPISVRTNSLAGSTAFVVLAGQRAAGFVSAATSVFIASGVASGGFAFTVHSLSELPGNHAFQTTAIDRPILRNRYNLLTKTEQFDDAAWTKSGVAVTANSALSPIGGMDADLLSGTAVPSGALALQAYSTSIKAGDSFTASLWVRNASANLVLRVARNGGGTYEDALVSIPQSSTWQRISVTKTFGFAQTGVNMRVWSNLTTQDVSIEVWGASLVPADQAHLPYQRVNTSTDYDSDPSKFPLYLAANGTNTWMQTNSIDFSSTDKVTVFAGVRKLSDAATGVLAELGGDSFSTNGAFGLFAPAGGGSFSYRVQARGTNTQAAGASAFAPSPDTAVIATYAGIAAGLVTLQRNGASVGSTVGSLGAGNYGNYPLYLFRRAGTSLPLNGNFYGLLIRGALTSDAQTIAMERWLAQKIGVTL